MLQAVERALALRADLGVVGIATEAQIERAIEGAGLEWWDEAPLEGRVYGFLFDGVVYVRRGVTPGTRLVVKAHELGHALLGHDAGAFTAVHGGIPVSRHEQDAHAFAFAALLGPPAATGTGITRQIQAGGRADLPVGFLFTSGSVLLALR